MVDDETIDFIDCMLVFIFRLISSFATHENETPIRQCGKQCCQEENDKVYLQI